MPTPTKPPFNPPFPFEGELGDLPIMIDRVIRPGEVFDVALPMPQDGIYEYIMHAWRVSTVPAVGERYRISSLVRMTAMRKDGVISLLTGATDDQDALVLDGGTADPAYVTNNVITSDQVIFRTTNGGVRTWVQRIRGSATYMPLPENV